MSRASELRRFIADCVVAAEQGDDSRLAITKHFRRRMRDRGLFWMDVVEVLLRPEKAEIKGRDRFGRTKCWITGSVVRVGRIRIVCSVDWDTRLVTLYWE